MSERIFERIPVTCNSKYYEVLVGTGLLENAGDYIRTVCKGSSAHIISDTNVQPLYGKLVKRSLEEAGFTSTGSRFLAGEQSKNLDVWANALYAMAEAELDRSDVCVALGGGVVGDLAGFAAASYMRGIQVVQLPTSLLAMVDSSVGGKTAVDIPQGKNLVGAFLQPSLVIADIATLDSLDNSQFKDAVGEIIKHAVLADADLLDEISSRPLVASRADASYVGRIVAKNVAIKRDVVVADERENGLRQTLNFGHTIGHAIEAASNYGIGHGSCVALGMAIMARASERMGWSSTVATARILECLEANDLPTTCNFDSNELIGYITHDKKRHGETITIVVAEDIGDIRLMPISLETLDELIRLGLE